MLHANVFVYDIMRNMGPTFYKILTFISGTAIIVLVISAISSNGAFASGQHGGTLRFLWGMLALLTLLMLFTYKRSNLTKSTIFNAGTKYVTQKKDTEVNSALPMIALIVVGTLIFIIAFIYYSAFRALGGD